MTNNNYSNNRKVSIIGSGNVGSSIAYALMLKDFTKEIVLVDINKKLSQAEVLDIRHGIPHMGSASIKSGEYSDIKDSDLIVVTAGRARRPGETRLDMVFDNIKIAKSVADEIKKYYNKGVILVASNPVDIITYKMCKWLNLPEGMVFGTGCILDSSRLTNVIADYLKLSPEAINSIVIGEHGESQIPVWSKVTVAGMPLAKYCETVGLEFNDEIKADMEDKVVHMGAEIISGKGKTHFGIATCVSCIADVILNRRTTVTTVASVLKGEYGVEDVVMSLPTIINYRGVERRLADELSDEELTRFRKFWLKIN